MRLKSYINEMTSEYGPGITFMDMDETIFKTDARTVIKNKKDNKIVARMRNREYLKYKHNDEEEVDFSEFSDAERFYNTAIPIDKTINRIKRIFKNIKNRESRVVIITARVDFDNKNKFLATFRKYGIPIDDIYVERIGSDPDALLHLSDVKKKVILKYLSTGLYRRARLIDDSTRNCKSFLELENEIPEPVLQLVRDKYNVPVGEVPISFYALKVKEDGSLVRVT